MRKHAKSHVSKRIKEELTAQAAAATLCNTTLESPTTNATTTVTSAPPTATTTATASSAAAVGAAGLLQPPPLLDLHPTTAAMHAYKTSLLSTASSAVPTSATSLSAMSMGNVGGGPLAQLAEGQTICLPTGVTIHVSATRLLSIFKVKL